MRCRTNSRGGPVCRHLARLTQVYLRNTGVHLLPPLQGPADDTAARKSPFSPGHYSPALVSSCQSKVLAVIVNSPGPRPCSQASCCGMRGVMCTHPTEIPRGGEVRMLREKGASAQGDDEQLGPVV